MSLTRLIAVVGSIVVLISCAFAQRNEISATFGRTFVSSQHVPGANFCNPDIHFGNEETVNIDYSRLLITHHALGLWAEAPISWFPKTDLNLGANLIPASYAGIFAAPSVRLNFFPGDSVTPWVSGGGGYGRFKEAGHLVFGGSNPGKIGTNTGVVQFGAGLDVWPWHRLGFRFEARDFYSGMPNLNVDTGRTRQHNYYVGGGVIRRF